MSDEYTILKNKLESHSANVVILGLGYVGLPLAVAMADIGFNVIGIDTNEEKVALLNKGESYIQDVPSSQVSKLVHSEKLKATTQFDAIALADAVSVCVPTPLRKTGDPDLSYILSATEELKQHVHEGMVIVLESTTYPGTTREVLLPQLTENNDLIVGENIFLAFSPERVDPGREDWTTHNTPKVIGGLTDACTDIATTYYAQALQRVVPVSSSEVAEMSKLLENTFRMINIGLVNEMALMCDKLGVNVWEVIEAAATKPFGFMKFTPGPGLGGHCIPIDPLYLSWRLKSLNYTARFIELASEINTSMPLYVVGKVQDALNEQSKPLKGSKVLVIGVAYKPDVNDIRESPALDVIGLLQNKGATVTYHDPYIPEINETDFSLLSVENLYTSIAENDCAVIITDHSDYDYKKVYENAKCIVDTRNALGEIAKDDEKVTRL